MGGILANSVGSFVQFFGDKVPVEVISKFKKTSDHPLNEVELLACALAASLRGHQTREGFVVIDCDNEAAQSALIRACGGTAPASAIVDRFVAMERHYQWRPWFGRVPTHSNPADSPSRLEFNSLLQKRVERVCVQWGAVLDFLRPRQLEWGSFGLTA